MGRLFCLKTTEIDKTKLAFKYPKMRDDQSKQKPNHLLYRIQVVFRPQNTQEFRARKVRILQGIKKMIIKIRTF